MNELHGRFYYRLTTNGNLVGEFSNNQSTHSQPESAERIPPSNGNADSLLSFLGEFRSTWFEPDLDQAILAHLVITQKGNTPHIFSLRWTPVPENNCEFLGEAMIGEDLLIGNYWMTQV